MSKRRIASLDALRGFDMMWIIGGDYLVHYLFAATGWSILGALSDQLRHAPWAGFTAYDLVFPLFMVLSGVSLGLVMERDAGVGPGAVVKAQSVRALILVILGVFYNWGWSIDLGTLRLASVLGLIGVTGFFATCILLFVKNLRTRLLVLSGLIVATTALHLLWGDLTPTGSINAALDQAFLPGRHHGGSYDPEGLFALFAATTLPLAGALVGQQMMRARRADAVFRIWPLVIIGTLCIAAGLALWPVYPPIKNLWTGTFLMISIGGCLWLIAGAAFVFDRLSCARLALVFSVIGANALLIYMAARYLVYPIYGVAALNQWPPLLSAAAVLGLLCAQWAILYALYQRRLFLRV